MKKLYKRLLAIVLCLALTAAIVPVTAFADDIYPYLSPLDQQWISEYEDVHYWPGQLYLYLKGLFLGDITELFPELDIEKYELRGRCPIEQQMDNPHYLARQSTTYYVELREKTCDAVLEALITLKDNPYLFAARPILGGIVPGEINVLLKEQYYEYGGPYPDLRDIFPEIDIESYSDAMLGPLTVNGEKPKEEIDQDLLDDVGKSFGIILTEKTVEAASRAVELLKNNPYVKWVGANQYLYADDARGLSFKFSVSDALCVLRVAAGLVEAEPEIATAFYDKDGDGKVTVADALIVLRLAAKLA